MTGPETGAAGAECAAGTLTTGATAGAGWSGDWVAGRLGVTVETSGSALGVDLSTLVGLALRRNPRRAHLLVSSVLGKHVPTDPRVVLAAGTLLGLLAADTLDAVTSVADAARSVGVASLLDEALVALPGAAENLLLTVDSLHDAVGAAERGGVVVLGYAETATALGHCVAAALGVPSLHSTRRTVPGVPAAAGFAEEHSHATEHLLLPQDAQMLRRARTLVLVDDEVSTGTTALNTIRALHADHPHERYVLATLVDLRTVRDQERFAETAQSLGTRIDVVALASGQITLPDGLLGHAAAVVEEMSTRCVEALSTASGSSPRGSAELRRRLAWAPAVREGGRHGFGAEDEQTLRQRTHDLAVDLAPARSGDRVLVLGFEELMYAPLLLGVALAALVPEGVDVRFSTTTRSPVLAVDDLGYAIRTTVTFPAHDDPDDGPGQRFAHNVAPGTDPSRGFTDIVVVVDSPADTLELSQAGGLLDVLGEVCDRVHLVVVPVLVPDARGHAALVDTPGSPDAGTAQPARPEPQEPTS